MDFSWTKDYPEILKICTLFDLQELSAPFNYKYTPIKGILQNGPQCGLVALAMCSDTPSKEFVDKLLTQAKSLCYSYNGEIFSAKYLYELAKTNLMNRSVEIYDGPLNSKPVKNFLQSGGLVLVPYDCDKNHAPATKNGHKAHWAVIIGIVESNNGRTYVLARHGKSQNVAVWDLEELQISNSQLNEYPEEEGKEFRIPEAGLGSPDGIRNKAIFIKGNF